MNAIISKLDKQKHKIILMSLLLDISKDELLKNRLVFKWGTSLFLLYNLDRFSTDLDFDLDWDTKKQEILKKLENIWKRYWKIKDSFIKRDTIFLLISYWEIEHNIKIEISTRWVSWEYSIKNVMWIKLKVLNIDYIVANKFIALTNRSKLANRDIYDIHFILKNHLAINKKHIENITWKSFENYIKEMIIFLQNLWDKYNILDWLWTTLDEKQKKYVKENLLNETIFLLHSLI